MNDVAGLDLAAERDPEPVAVGVGVHPPPRGGHLLDAAGADELMPVAHGHLVAPRPLGQDGARDGPSREFAGDAAGVGRAQEIGCRRHRAVWPSRHPVVGTAGGGNPDAVGRSAVVAERDHRDARPPVGRESRPAAGQVDRDNVRALGQRVGCVRSALGQVGEHVGPGADHPDRAGGVGLSRVRDVR